MARRLTAVLLLLAAGCQPPPPPAASPAPPAAAPAPAPTSASDSTWFGLSLLGKRAGWTHLERRREPRDGRAVEVYETESLVQATVGGALATRRLAESRTYDAAPPGRLLAFEARWSGDGGDRSLAGTCTPAACRATLRAADGSARERPLPPIEETSAQADGVRLAASLRATMTGPQLDLATLQPATVTQAYLRRERLVAGGGDVEVSVVAETQGGDRQATEYRVADDGRILEIRFGGAIVARAESPAQARRLDAVDLFALAAIPLPAAPTRAVPAIVAYRLAGLPPAFRRADARQAFTANPDGTTTLTVRAARPAAADPARDTPRATPGDPALPADERDLVAATPEIDADAPAIVALARKVAGDAPGRYAAALRLSAEVYRRLAKTYGASNDRASDVLSAGRGDCTEHSLLTVALARALAIPARQVHGLVHVPSATGPPALLWHAWVEIRSGGEWIALDPTLGQPVADATHLALGADRQADTIGLLGSLKVLSVEVLAPR